MANDDNHQYFITIPNSNGETIIITPEILPEQLLPLVQKKQFKEKIDLSNLTSAYRKIIENLTENGSTLSSITSLNNIINVNSDNSSRIKSTASQNELNKNRDNNSSSSSIINSRSSVPTILLHHSNLNQSTHNLQSSISNDRTLIPSSIADNSNNYITTLQISQNNSTLAFTQPQALLQYSDQNHDSANAVLIPISLHNSNQFSQQQILVAAAAVASGGYNQHCNNNGSSNALNSNAASNHNLNTTSLAKLISSNVTNPLSISIGDVMRSNSVNSDVSPSSKSSNNKRKYNVNSTDEFGKRKEIRLLKNREAARECRRKKKEYVKCLENRVTNLEQQNKVLVDEINRMKELYNKKISKKSINVPPEADHKYMNNFPLETQIKDNFYETPENDCEIISINDKSCINHPQTGLTSSNTQQTNLNQPKNKSKDLSTSETPRISSLSTNVPSNPRDPDNLFLTIDKEISKSQLSALLVNKTHKNAHYSLNSAIFPEFQQEENSKLEEDSNSSCDLN